MFSPILFILFYLFYFSFFSCFDHVMGTFLRWDGGPPGAWVPMYRAGASLFDGHFEQGGAAAHLVYDRTMINLAANDGGRVRS